MTAELIRQLRADLKGRVIAPEDPEYDEARLLYFGGFDRRPAAIARVANAADVARVVVLVQESGLELAVRSGGHSNAGHSVTEGGIVVDLSTMKTLDIDRASGTAWADTGLTAGEFSNAAGAHGLALGFGDGGRVGIGGITLGGGVGLLIRKYGLTIDALIGAEIVTADGKILQIDDTNHPDLFWAIRGGGGNFGVVTRFHFRLYPVDRVLGGILVLPATADVLASLIKLLDAAPEELTAIVNVINAPPAPFIPAEHHGKVVAMVNMVYAGRVEDGERAVAPLRALATPVADMVRAMRYPEIFPPQPVMRPLVVQHAAFLDGFDRAAAATIVEQLNASTGPTHVCQLRVLGGAITRVPNDATAYGFRNRKIMVTLAVMYQEASEGASYQAWVDGFAAALPRHAPGVYTNFMKNEGEARIREAYPEPIWDRLTKVKSRYDPTNLFKLNQNVPPAKA